MRVRPLEVGDLTEAALLHRQVLDMEFLSRYGLGFMRLYYRAWMQSPASISLAAVDDDDCLVGSLLGAVDPAAHVRGMVRNYGLRLGIRLLTHAAVHPRLAIDLIATRGVRYVRGVVRVIATRLRPPPRPTLGEGEYRQVAEITHLLVKPNLQGMGIGRELVAAAVSMAKDAGRDEMVLVTPPDLAARGFYERLGWIVDREMTSRSGEAFVHFRLPLNPPGSNDGLSEPGT